MVKSAAEMEREALVAEGLKLSDEAINDLVVGGRAMARGEGEGRARSGFAKYYPALHAFGKKLEAFNAANPDLAIKGEEVCP